MEVSKTEYGRGTYAPVSTYGVRERRRKLVDLREGYNYRRLADNPSRPMDRTVARQMLETAQRNHTTQWYTKLPHREGIRTMERRAARALRGASVVKSAGYLVQVETDPWVEAALEHVSKKKVADAPKGEYVPHPTNAGLNPMRYSVEHRRGEGGKAVATMAAPAAAGALPGIGLFGEGVRRSSKLGRKGRGGLALMLGGHAAAVGGAAGGAHYGMNRNLKRGRVRVRDLETGKKATRTTFLMTRPTGWVD